MGGNRNILLFTWAGRKYYSDPPLTETEVRNFFKNVMNPTLEKISEKKYQRMVFVAYGDLFIAFEKLLNRGNQYRKDPLTKLPPIEPWKIVPASLKLFLEAIPKPNNYIVVPEEVFGQTRFDRFTSNWFATLRIKFPPGLWYISPCSTQKELESLPEIKAVIDLLSSDSEQGYTISTDPNLRTKRIDIVAPASNLEEHEGPESLSKQIPPAVPELAVEKAGKPSLKRPFSP